MLKKKYYPSSSPIPNGLWSQEPYLIPLGISMDLKASSPIGQPCPARPSLYFKARPSFFLPYPTPNLSFPTFQNPRIKTRPRRLSMSNSLQSSVVDSPNEGLEASPSGMVGENDLLIVGPGVLGRIIAEKWRQENPGCQVFGQTLTADHHDELVKIGISPFLRESEVTNKFPYVVFCAPPSRTTDYPSDVRMAASKWNGEGSLLFTSSTAAYDCNDNGFCDEDSPFVPIGRSPRTDVLLKAENAILEVGGSVLRLAGLYKLDRGAHAYWLEKGTVNIRPDHILNLIHYEDAASLSVTILRKKLRGRIFLGCDNHPLSRQEVMDYVNRSCKFSKKFQGFTGTDDPLGKRMNNSKTRAEVGWEPKYKNFAHFLGLSD